MRAPLVEGVPPRRLRGDREHTMSLTQAQCEQRLKVTPLADTEPTEDDGRRWCVGAREDLGLHGTRYVYWCEFHRGFCFPHGTHYRQRSAAERCAARLDAQVELVNCLPEAPH